MSEQTYNFQIINQYLLGTLDDAETERFDGLSITDDQFAETLQAAEKDLVDAYVRGELVGDELEKFRSYYLASRVRSEKVEFARTFHDWAEANLVKGVKTRNEVLANRGRSNWLMPGLFVFPRFPWRWGFVAVVLALFITAGLLVFQNVRLRQDMAQAQVRRDELAAREQKLQNEIDTQRLTSRQAEQELARVRDERDRLEEQQKQRGQPSVESAVVSLILTPPLRGADQIHTLFLKPGANQVAAKLQLEASDYSAYRVSLIDPAANKTLWQSGRLKAGQSRNGRALSLNFPASLLKPNTYILQVSGIAANNKPEAMSDYSFKVVK
jgi:hypothetical protein